MGTGRSSAATSHVRPNRLSAGIPAGPLARAATSASHARDADGKANFRQHPGGCHRRNEAARKHFELSNFPFRFSASPVGVSALHFERTKRLDQPRPIDETLHRRRTKKKPPPLGENQVSVALSRTARRASKARSPLASRARTRTRSFRDRATASGDPRDHRVGRVETPISLDSVTTSRFRTKTHSGGG